jgi:hypothetical protein
MGIEKMKNPPITFNNHAIDQNLKVKGWKNPFLHSYLFYHRPNEFPHYPTMDYHNGIVPQIPLMQLTPFTMLSPLELIQMVVPFMDR